MNLTTDTCNGIRRWYGQFAHKEAYAAILLAFSPITILLNLSLIISFIATRQVTQNATNILIFALSFCDLTSGALFMPLRANTLLDLNAEDFCIKSKILIMLSSNGQSSLILTFLIALDRYLHMNPDITTRPSKIMKILKPPNIYYVLATTFFVTNTLSAAVAFKFLDMEIFLLASIFTIILSIQLVFITCLYAKGYLRIRKFADNNPVYDEPMGSTPDYVRRLYKTVLVIVSLALLQHVPYCITVVIGAVHYDPVHVNSNAAFSYFLDFALLSTHAGCFTNCLAILYFNTRAKNWLLTKTRIPRILEQCKQT